MSKISAETLESFLQRQPASALCALLLELAQSHEAVNERQRRLQLSDRPDKLAAGFRKTLTAWRRSTQFHGYRESGAYGSMLQEWLDQVARELTPKDPAAAVELFESFIEADGTWFEHADDSDGVIGDAVRTACRYWLQAAAACETPESVRIDRLMRLFLADVYGAREELLRQVNLLLSEAALRTLAGQLESRMAASFAGLVPGTRPPPEVSKDSAALALLSEALRDPDVEVRAVLRRYPDPNPVQRQSFAQAYLKVGRAADALTWLQGSWEHMEGSREVLLAGAFEQFGRFEDSLPIRQRMFEDSPAVFYLQLWLEHVPLSDRAAALAHARQVALDHADPTAAAIVLLELGDAEASEARLVDTAGRMDGRNYPELVPLAKRLRTHER